ncbi:MAG TPA: YdcH family protein [Thermoanaerobaculia bacterium]|nr:YdcH family protein [Thermoanaerobaculia bacterium]
MSNRTADIQRLLSQEDPEFQEWVEEHHRCEARLSELITRSEVSTDEEIEEKTLKKRKLRLKDQMAERIRSYESSHATA